MGNNAWAGESSGCLTVAARYKPSSCQFPLPRGSEPQTKRKKGESPLIPIVSTYRYLGIVVNQQLDYAAMARARAEAARKVFCMMQHTLRDRRLPITSASRSPRRSRCPWRSSAVVPSCWQGALAPARGRLVLGMLCLGSTRVLGSGAPA